MNPDSSLFGATEPDSNSPKFEDALIELDRVVRVLEAGETGLEEAIGQYEKGVQLLKQCFGQLRQVEMRISELTGVDETGKPTTRPFDHASSTELKAEKKPRRAAKD